mmetsp:Transcript_7937/g.16127  ORF Transcript_7937/g.16127 Transcript_7937/m.16127 type:complete len:211 (-) Transcript_7937:814-1446(-)
MASLTSAYTYAACIGPWRPCPQWAMATRRPRSQTSSTFTQSQRRFLERASLQLSSQTSARCSTRVTRSRCVTRLSWTRCASSPDSTSCLRNCASSSWAIMSSCSPSPGATIPIRSPICSRRPCRRRSLQTCTRRQCGASPCSRAPDVTSPSSTASCACSGSTFSSRATSSSSRESSATACTSSRQDICRSELQTSASCLRQRAQARISES